MTELGLVPERVAEEDEHLRTPLQVAPARLLGRLRMVCSPSLWAVSICRPVDAPKICSKKVAAWNRSKRDRLISSGPIWETHLSISSEVHNPDAAGNTPGRKAADSGLEPILDRNIHVLYERRQREIAAEGLESRLAGAMTRFAGSMLFVYVHIIVFSLWIVANLGWAPGVPVWDPSFAVLAMVASVEAIFLSTFVLITQNRMASAADKRADLDLQISLLAEHEVTRLAAVVSDIAKALNVQTAAEREIEPVKSDIKPESVLDRLETSRKLPESGR